jgi:hypothetical protein
MAASRRPVPGLDLTEGLISSSATLVRGETVIAVFQAGGGSEIVSSFANVLIRYSSYGPSPPTKNFLAKGRNIGGCLMRASEVARG